MTEASTIPPEAPTSALAKVIVDLEPSKASALKAAFGGMFEQVEAWETEARALVVTEESQTGRMQRARSLRLEVRKARVELDRRRKVLKEASLREGRAIDASYRIFETLAEPLEARLLEYETFATRAAEARENQLADARRVALLALGVAEAAIPASLGRLTEDVWGHVLEDAKIAKAAREKAAQEAEEARVEADRIIRERRAKEAEDAKKAEAERLASERATAEENERLRAEAEAKDREVRLERQKQEAALAHEREEREKAEAEAARVKAEAEAKAAAEAREKELAELAPDREKLLRLAEQVSALDASVTAPKAVDLMAKIRQRLGKLATEIAKAAGSM